MATSGLAAQRPKLSVSLEGNHEIIDVDADTDALLSPSMVLMASSGSKSSRSPQGKHLSLEDLLAQQQAAAQQVLAFNAEIAKRLKEGREERQGGLSPAGRSQSGPAISSGRPAEAIQAVSASDVKAAQRRLLDPGKPESLLEPLLPEDAAEPGDAHEDHDESLNPNKRIAYLRSDYSETVAEQELKSVLHGKTSQPLRRSFSRYLLDRQSFAERIVQHRFFGYASVLAITLNTIWMSIDTDYNKAEFLCDAPLIFQVVDNLFCFFFTVELILRFLAFERMCEALRSGQFLFDLALVALMVWETWVQVALHLEFGIGSEKDPSSSYGINARSSTVLRVFRIFRLSRLFRTARLLRALPELMILFKGMVAAVRSVMATLGILVLIIYIMGIMFTQMLNDQDVAKGRFESVPMSMNFLLLQVLCGIQADVVMDLLAAGPLYYLMFLVFVLLASLTVMNMLIGVLCEVVSNVAEHEREEEAINKLNAMVDGMVADLDKDGTGSVDKNEFEALIQDQAALTELRDLGVDLVAFVDFVRFIFPEDGELSVNDFRHILLQFRGSKAATVKDIVDVRKCLSMELSGLEARVTDHLRDNLQAITRRGT